MAVTRHIPVLLEEVLSTFEFPGVFLDCTLGGGGHSEALLQAHRGNRVRAFDRDTRAIDRTRDRLACYGARFTVSQASFAEITMKVAGEKFDGILADLGMSTDQLFEGRGFSFQDDSALDMRMDETQDLTAEEVLNNYSERELVVMFKQGGLEKAAKPMASAIVRDRPLSSTRQLVDLAAAVLSRFQKRSRDRESGRRESHPATVVFQALRMEVNQELAQIRSLMSALPELIKPGGRAAIISFHSLEDKEVARVMRLWAQGSTLPARLQTGREEPPLGRLLTRKAIVPSEDEVGRNPASRSARMRVFEFVQ